MRWTTWLLLGGVALVYLIVLCVRTVLKEIDE